MKVRQIGRIISVALLLSVFLYSTAVRELHYAFAAKYHTEVRGHLCDHHIHSTDHEEDCLICKVDVNGLFENAQNYYSFSAVFLPRPTVPSVSKVFFATQCDIHYLRGPPSLA